jgi:hypothetical protein
MKKVGEKSIFAKTIPPRKQHVPTEHYFQSNIFVKLCMTQKRTPCHPLPLPKRGTLKCSFLTSEFLKVGNREDFLKKQKRTSHKLSRES